MNDKTMALLQHIPGIDEMLLILEADGFLGKNPRELVVKTCRDVVSETRKAILDKSENKKDVISVPSAEQAAAEVRKRLARLHRYSLRRVVNATGVVLHTNLGRAPLCPEAVDRVIDVSAGYSNLEFDLETGKRGHRYDHVSDKLCSLTGAEDALVVNNNAAAVLLVLNTLSRGKEAVVSRGELIEIGGAFRIPEVMEKSGAKLREIGTTNRTHLYDYENALCDSTGVMLKVHTSNFKTVGFTEEVGLSDLIELGSKHGVPVINDLGSGCFVEIGTFGFEREPTVQEVMRTGVDIVTFSGDKLLGGPQAGIILGKHVYIEKIKNNALHRALRIDKMTLAALEGTIRHYLDTEGFLERLRSWKCLTEPLEEVRLRAMRLLRDIEGLSLPNISVTTREGFSMAGGGSLPGEKIPTVLVALDSLTIPSARIEEGLRRLDVPVIARIADDDILLDARTVDDSEIEIVVHGLKTVWKEAAEVLIPPAEED